MRTICVLCPPAWRGLDPKGRLCLLRGNSLSSIELPPSLSHQRRCSVLSLVPVLSHARRANPLFAQKVSQLRATPRRTCSASAPDHSFGSGLHSSSLLIWSPSLQLKMQREVRFASPSPRPAHSSGHEILFRRMYSNWSHLPPYPRPRPLPHAPSGPLVGGRSSPPLTQCDTAEPSL